MLTETKLVKFIKTSRASDTEKHELSINDPFKKAVTIVRKVTRIKLMTIWYTSQLENLCKPVLPEYLKTAQHFRV